MNQIKGDAVIRCEGVWKIFGRRAKEAYAAVRRDGLTKTQIRDRFDCVVGVRDASFEVHRGEIFCIMGLSGSGKSTLIRHINRLIEPTAGAIFIDGQDVNGLSQAELRKVRAEKIGMVFQNMALMPHRTVLDNVAFSQEVRGHEVKARQDTARRAIAAVDLAGWETRYPDELSGGMQQRVGLARAFATEAPILLMDEPFSALDPLIRTRLQDELLELQAKTQRTIIFVSHDLDEAFKLGNRIALMEGGRIVQIGTARDIIANPVSEYVADFVAHMNPLGVLTAADVVQPGPAAEDLGDDPVPRDMPVREVMGLLADRTALPVQGGGCITRDAVLARLIDPRG